MNSRKLTSLSLSLSNHLEGSFSIFYFLFLPGAKNFPLFPSCHKRWKFSEPTKKFCQQKVEIPET
ncbi:MAG: hypothetical protein V2G52_00005, partial [bacterium JZ-2024 1]